ncbi:MAG: DUF1501 domain-containing protein [Akkermansiaceae bacterium]|nr:DUF1501 domain-containing protein [Akkermansiaceae bacterium]
MLEHLQDYPASLLQLALNRLPEFQTVQYFRDLHATMIHLLGLRPNELTFHHAGRDHRLTGPEGGRVVQEIFA